MTSHYQFLPSDSWESKLLDLALKGIEEQFATQRSIALSPEASGIGGEVYRWEGLLITHDPDDDSVNIEMEDLVVFLEEHGLPVTYQRAAKIARDGQADWCDIENLADDEEREQALAAAQRKESPNDR